MDKTLDINPDAPLLDDELPLSPNTEKKKNTISVQAKTKSTVAHNNVVRIDI
mgnify:CR=1 FL=1